MLVPDITNHVGPVCRKDVFQAAIGDAAEGPLAQASCDISASTRGNYDIRVIGSDAAFELQAHPLSPTEVAVFAVDHLGRKRWLDGPS